jgi:hypothetical protein
MGSKIPGMDGGLLLDTQRPTPGTQHTTDFQASIIGIGIMHNEEGVVLAYQVTIQDRVERHRYTFSFDEKVRQDLLKQLMEVPSIGEKVEVDA